MTFEVEIKARLRYPAETEARAAKLGVFHKESLKEDIYFKHMGDGSPAPKNRFRLRKEAGRATVTFKENMARDGIEVNRETEFDVDDAHAFYQFAHRFGFEPFLVKRKKSRVYRIEQANVEFNEIDQLGYFIEIERLCADPELVPMARTEVARLLNELGISAGDVEARPYMLLLHEAHPAKYRFINDRSLDWPFEELLLDQDQSER